MSFNWNNDTDNLIEAVLTLRDKQEARNFLRDLLTEKELVEFANRWKVAQLLNDQIPYSQIEKATGLSSTTIARISKWLTNGTGGYKAMLSRVAHHHSAINARLREE